MLDQSDGTFVPVEGRSVVYQLAEGEYRPAQIVKLWNPTEPYTANLVVFLDGTNDWRYGTEGALTAWKTSVYYGTAVGQYQARKPV